MQSENHKGVFIRSSQTHAERLIQLNFKTILNELPNGQKYYVTGNGRLVRQLVQDAKVNNADKSNTNIFRTSASRQSGGSDHMFLSPPLHQVWRHLVLVIPLQTRQVVGYHNQKVSV